MSSMAIPGVRDCMCRVCDCMCRVCLMCPWSALSLAGGAKVGIIKAEIDDGAAFYVNGE